ncbi:MAG: PatB family C-S lyase [Anaerolineales bacterium]
MPYNFDEMLDRRRVGSIKWNRYDPDVIPLWVADMDFRASDPVIQALQEHVAHGNFGYPEWNPSYEAAELREAVLGYLERQYGWQVESQALVFLPAQAIGLFLSCRALALPGEGMLVQTPAYGTVYDAHAKAGLRINTSEMVRNKDGHYEIDLDLFEKTIASYTRLFILVNPHNPLGKVFRRDELQAMASICLHHDMYIISDEVYGDIIYPPHRHIPIASLAPEIADRTVTLISPGKSFCLAGMRLAVAIVTNPELRRRLLAVMDGSVTFPNVLSVTAAAAAYRQEDRWLDEVIAYLEANRDFLWRSFHLQFPGISMEKPEGTFLAWLDCRTARLPGGPHRFFLEQARVACNNGADFPPGCEGFVRLNFACSRLVLEKAVQQMHQALFECA